MFKEEDDRSEEQEALRVDPKDWVRAINGVIGTLSHRALCLNDIANSLEYVGAVIPASSLRNTAEKLRECAALLRNAMGAKIDDDCRWARENTGNLLRAALAGCITNAKDKDQEESLKKALDAAEKL